MSEATASSKSSDGEVAQAGHGVRTPPRSTGGGTARLQRPSESTAELLLAAVDTASSGFALLHSHLSSEAFIDPGRLRTVRALGEGAFGRTHRAELAPKSAAAAAPQRMPSSGSSSGTCSTRARSRPRDVAVKTLRKELLEDAETVLLFVKEVELLKKLRHRSIVELIGCSWQRSSLDSSVRHGAGSGGIKTIYFVQEYCAGGSLGDLVRRQMIRPYKRLYSDADALRWCLGIASALQYLHGLAHPVMHRDLKLDNVMLSCADVARADAKLGDFGLARLTVEEERRKKEGQDAAAAAAAASAKLAATAGAPGRDDSAQQPCLGRPSACDVAVCAGLQPGAALFGTPRRFAAAMEPTGRTGSFGYMAPEVLRSQQYDASCDIFSLGMCMHNMFARVLPSFQILLQGGAEQLEQYAALVADGYRPPLPAALPPALAALISDCWKGDPALRPSAAAVVARLEEIRDSGVVPHSARMPRPGCCTVM